MGFLDKLKTGLETFGEAISEIPEDLKKKQGPTQTQQAKVFKRAGKFFEPVPDKVRVRDVVREIPEVVLGTGINVARGTARGVTGLAKGVGASPEGQASPLERSQIGQAILGPDPVGFKKDVTDPGEQLVALTGAGEGLQRTLGVPLGLGLAVADIAPSGKAVKPAISQLLKRGAVNKQVGEYLAKSVGDTPIKATTPTGVDIDVTRDSLESFVGKTDKEVLKSELSETILEGAEEKVIDSLASDLVKAKNRTEVATALAKNNFQVDMPDELIEAVLRPDLNIPKSVKPLAVYVDTFDSVDDFVGDLTRIKGKIQLGEELTPFERFVVESVDDPFVKNLNPKDFYKKAIVELEATKIPAKLLQRNKTRLSRLSRQEISDNNIRLSRAVSDVSLPKLEPSINVKDNFVNNTIKRFKNKEAVLKTQEKFQDQWVRVKRLMEGKGVKFTDESNPYQKRILFDGAVFARKENLKKAVESIQKDIQKTSKKLNIDADEIRKDVNDYLIARHAPERNKALGDGAAGITNAEAKALQKNLSAKVSSKDIERFANELQKINNEVLDILLEGEVITKELYDTLRKKYPNHVPLNRVIDEMSDTDFVEVLGTKGFDVKGAGIKRAKGSEREVKDIVGNIMANYSQAVERAYKNQVNLATLKLARDNDFFGGTFDEFTPKAIGTGFKGETLFEQVTDQAVIAIREDGMQKYLRVNDPNLAVALKSIGSEQLPSLIRAVAKITRFYSSMATRFNPEFWITNIVRDTQDLAVNTGALTGNSRSVAKQPQSVKDIVEWMSGKDSDGARLYEQMRLDGGTTGGMALSTRDEIDLNIKEIIKNSKKSPKSAFNSAIKAIDNANQIFEDATRLSAYKSALDAGMTRSKAAFVAKNATVNFNMKGSATPLMNALYMFSNASVQGSVRTLKSLANPRVAAVTTGILGSVVYQSHRQNDVIDPDWRTKITEYDKNHNLVFVLPNSTKEIAPDDTKGFVQSQNGIRYITIPVSWGLKPIKVLMDRTYEASTDQLLDNTNVAVDVANSLFDAYNPIGGSDFISGVTPTVLDLPLEVARNKAWHGGVIFPEWKKNLPGSEQIYDDFGEGMKEKSALQVSKMLETANIDMSPMSLEYIYDSLVGGVGRSVSRLGTTAQTLVGARDADPRDLFALNRFYKEKTGEQTDWVVKSKDREDILSSLRRVKDEDERRQLIKEYVDPMSEEEAKKELSKIRSVGYSTTGITHKYKIRDEERYFEIQDLIRSGRGDEALQITQAMSEEEYNTYKEVRSTVRRNNTKKMRELLEESPAKAVAFVRSQTDGEAQRLAGLLTPEEYSKYQTGKDKVPETQEEKIINSFEPKQEEQEKDTLDRIILFAKALGVSPRTALKTLSTTNNIEYVRDGVIKIERMPFEQSQEQRFILGADNEVELDHIIPLQLGGTNNESNLELVPKALHREYTKAGNLLRDKVEEDKIKLKKAQKLIKEFRAGEITLEDIKAL